MAADGRAGGGGALRGGAKHPLRPAAGDAEMAAACDELALGVLNGAIARLDGALASSLAKWRHARCAEAIEVAARALPTLAEPSVVAAARREAVATAMTVAPPKTSVEAAVKCHAQFEAGLGAGELAADVLLPPLAAAANGGSSVTMAEVAKLRSGVVKASSAAMTAT